MGFNLGSALGIAGTANALGAGGLLGGIASFAGPIAQYFGQQDTNNMNKDMAEAQMGFQERMSSTAHQREVNDLQAAGLNPILSANAGESTPAGATTNMQNPVDGSQLQAAVTSAYELQKTGAETDLLKAQKANTQADTLLKAKSLPQKEGEGELFNMINPFLKKLGNSLSSSPKSQEPENFSAHSGSIKTNPNKPSGGYAMPGVSIPVTPDMP